jgi:hypothetical protein
MSSKTSWEIPDRVFPLKNRIGRAVLFLPLLRLAPHLRRACAVIRQGN